VQNSASYDGLSIETSREKQVIPALVSLAQFLAQSKGSDTSGTNAPADESGGTQFA